MDRPTTGIDELDSALGGLLWGDNVVWEVDDSTAPEPFYAAVADKTDRYDYAAYVALLVLVDVESRDQEVIRLTPQTCHVHQEAGTDIWTGESRPSVRACGSCGVAGRTWSSASTRTRATPSSTPIRSCTAIST
jgi:hypothetical protein